MAKVNINIQVNYLSGRKEKVPFETNAPFVLDAEHPLLRSMLDQAQANTGADEVDDIKVTAKLIGI